MNILSPGGLKETTPEGREIDDHKLYLSQQILCLTKNRHVTIKSFIVK